MNLQVPRQWCMRIVATGVATTVLVLASFGSHARQADDPEPCRKEVYQGYEFVVCGFDRHADIRLFWRDTDNKPFGHFGLVDQALSASRQGLAFAMNAGMYHKDRSPVGLYVEKGAALSKANTNPGPGNFHLLPNGVFFITDGGAPGVEETNAFQKTDRAVKFATQSGPMLVIDGALHPRFLENSTSKKRRNGVGVTAAGDVVFVLSDSPVNFYTFGSYFRDVLSTPNALYLDGTISRLYAPALGRNDPGAAMGPIVGVVEKK